MAKNKVKYIFITGGVISSLGKGIAAASLGLLLKSRGLRVTIQKFDPYINVDPGTMNPFQHGEVYVTDDGAETDLDCGGGSCAPCGGGKRCLADEDCASGACPSGRCQSCGKVQDWRVPSIASTIYPVAV